MPQPPKPPTRALDFPWRQFLGAVYVALVGVALGIVVARLAGPEEIPRVLAVSVPIHPMAPKPARPSGAYAAVPRPAGRLTMAETGLSLYPTEEFPPRRGAPERALMAVRKAALGRQPAPPWRRFAAATEANGRDPMIALVIDDLGPNRKRALRAFNLKAPLTLSFLPYARDLRALVARARAMGHEILMHIPMEPLEASRHDVGPNALLVDLDRRELVRRLNWNLNRFSGYVGINNHMGSRFTADRTAMTRVMREIKDRGLLFLDSWTTPDSLGTRLAGRFGVPHVGRDVFLDNERSADDVARQLDLAERIARRDGVAVAIGHPHSQTLAALERWIEGLGQRGITLVPVSTVAALREEQARFAAAAIAGD